MSGRSQNRDLARLARETARESSGNGRKAWLCAAVALNESPPVRAAKAVLADVLEPGELQLLALACLASLCHDDEPARAP